jgi:hypothetical protein
MRRRTGYYDRHPEERPGSLPIKPPTPVDPQLAGVRERHKVRLAALKNVHTGVAEGYVYVVTNPAWPGWVKVGCAVDYEDRTATYQTGSPHRDYVCQFFLHSERRVELEKEVHRRLEHTIHGGEWFMIDVETAAATIKAAKKFCDDTSTSGKE